VDKGGRGLAAGILRFGRYGVFTVMASFSPNLGVTNPSTTLPAVMPSQKPVALMPDAKGVPRLTWIMKVTIHPPNATSTPTYASKNREQTHVTRLVRASLVRPPFLSLVRGLAARNLAPVSGQKAVSDAASSITAAPIMM